MIFPLSYSIYFLTHLFWLESVLVFGRWHTQEHKNVLIHRVFLFMTIPSFTFCFPNIQTVKCNKLKSVFQLCCTTGQWYRGIGESELLSRHLQSCRLIQNIVALQDYFICPIYNLVGCTGYENVYYTLCTSLYLRRYWIGLDGPRSRGTQYRVPLSYSPYSTFSKIYQNRLHEYCYVQCSERIA